MEPANSVMEHTPPVLKVPVAAKPSAGIPYKILTIN